MKLMKFILLIAGLNFGGVCFGWGNPLKFGYSLKFSDAIKFFRDENKSNQLILDQLIPGSNNYSAQWREQAMKNNAFEIAFIRKCSIHLAIWWRSIAKYFKVSQFEGN